MYVKREGCARYIWQQDIENLFIYKNKKLNMAKKTYVSPGSPYDPSKDSSLGAKDGQLDDFEGFNDDEFTSQW